MSVPRGLKAVLNRAPTDTLILSALRTPICRSYKGGLKDAYPEELLARTIDATLRQNSRVNPTSIQDVGVGVVLSELGGSKAARAALNTIRRVDTSATSLYTVNRACASSLQAIALVSGQIKTGMIDVGIAAGMESMTRNYGSKAIPSDVWPHVLDEGEHGVKDARECLMPMGLTSENVSKRYGVSRSDQDAFAVQSHVRASHATKAGHFKQEIVPVTTQVDGAEKIVSEDDGIRHNISLEGLTKLKPAFAADGASTAGNSSQVSDGAAALLVMRRSRAVELGLDKDVIGKFVAAKTVGCKPDEMGIGPALAIPALLEQLGLENDEVDRWEINEAFASQAIYSLRQLGLEEAWRDGKVNPDGGAIALGHPLGATGARLATTLLHGLGRTQGQIGVVSMCVGTGMGMAGLFVREF